ncbi:queuosine 5'-phosphate N-glycosylase/hydrolase-like isoform X2 [Ruditapes philippinarum]|uniref:queuosine 5'-phosphate N-glycosylase/hydrolase-like isoform X2 n=1 Tax=Ruditapes philippinarum TaxID=129788 RepID=UPI00295BD316|nr:queuosine 5'-phosphate N-glycosylase/hydrolase-like isoform X2 [Ruditapes philippinarum]
MRRNCLLSYADINSFNHVLAHNLRMCDILMPRDAGRYISERSKDVKIIDNGVQKVAMFMADCVRSGTYNIKSWKMHTLNPKVMDENTLNWIFVTDTLNFSFWTEDVNKKFKVKYNGEDYTGYWSLCAAINRALDKGIPFTNPEYFANITKEQMTDVLRSDSDYDIPLFEERLTVLREAGRVLVEKYGGSVAKLVQRCGKSAQTMMKQVVKDFSSYRDETEFEGQKVAIYKRVQILIADIWACFEGQGYGEFHDIDTITMFADYRIPQALLYFGALQYSDELVEYLKTPHLLKSGDRYEVEIRGCSIWATELINKETRKLLDADAAGKNLLVNSILIDHYLWDYRLDHAGEMADLPLHKIRCIYY